MPTSQAPLLGEPAPVELINTIWGDRDGTHDALATAGDVAGWLTALAGTQAGTDVDLPAGTLRVTASVAAQYRSLRDALRRLAAEACDEVDRGEPITLATALATLNEACARAPSWSTVQWLAGETPGRSLRSSRGPAETTLARLAEQAALLFTGPQLPQLRSCGAPGCILYFVRDHPRREWCSAACGNRARVARHYARHHGPSQRGLG